MYENLSILRLSGALAGHAAQRQSLTAHNIANADTPGFKAQDLPDFKQTYETTLRATRGSHVGPAATAEPIADLSTEASPNGNTVSLEREMVRAAEIRHQHDLALSVYRSSLGILRTSLGRGR